jgi:endonuclease V-like protein UPF0215 family
VLAIEDGAFSKADKYCLLLGVITTDNSIERFFVDHIRVDGRDATRTIASFVRCIRKANLILLPSISLGGFNVVSPHELHKETRLPILIVNPVRPNMHDVRRALQRHFSDWRERIHVFDLMGSPDILRLTPNDRIYFYCVGLPRPKAMRILRHLVRFGKKPEPLRIARIVARALSDSPSMKTPRSI